MRRIAVIGALILILLEKSVGTREVFEEGERTVCKRLVIAGLTLLLGLSSIPGAAQTCTPTSEEQMVMKEAYDRLRESGVVSGSPSLGHLDSSMSRAQFSVILVRALGWSEVIPPENAPSSFPDMNGHWAARQIALLQREGIVRGYPGGDFRPDDNIRLVETKLMLARLLRLGPDVTQESVDGALEAAGVSTRVACPSDGPVQPRQAFVLLDRSLSVTLYSRHR